MIHWNQVTERNLYKKLDLYHLASSLGSREPWTENLQSLDFAKPETGYPQIDIL
jgi:hypothetical protein